MRDKMVVMGHWFEKCGLLSKNQMEKLCYLIIQYGLNGEVEDCDDAMVLMIFNFIREEIDRIQEYSDNMIEMGQYGGRSKKCSDTEIFELAVEGMSAKEIANALEVNPSTIYRAEGWKKFKLIQEGGLQPKWDFDF